MTATDTALARYRLTRRESEVFWLVADRLRNREIAERLHIGERTVESHVASLLRKTGGGDRSDLVALGEGLRRRHPPRHRLPDVLSSFVGRDAELVTLAGMVREHRLVTLVGPGGVGKTRLGLEVASRTPGMPAAVFVDLAPRTAEVAPAFANALGLVESDTGLRSDVREALAADSWWLIVDNCEHVLSQTADLLGDWLSAAPRLRVLATSRSPLGLRGEAVVPVAPLEVADDDTPESVRTVASCRLFVHRAATASPDFAVTPANAAAITQLCRRLDGLPLAIELAAARIRAFSPAELLRHLDDRFRLLEQPARDGDARHRTLEAALRWSYELLDDGERLLFDRCTVFPAEFDYDTAAEILAFPPLGDDEFLRTFPRLLDRSLVSSRRLPDESTAYRMLETFREFGRTQLATRGELAELSRRHARYHIDQAIVLARRGGGNVIPWFAAHWTDLAAAVRWRLDEGDVDGVWRLLAGVGRRWDAVGLRGELFEWLEELLRQPFPDGELGLAARTTASFLLWYRDTQRAYDLAREADELAPPDDARIRAQTELTRGWAAAYRGDRAEAVAYLERAAERSAALGDRWEQALALQGLGVAARDPEGLITRMQAAATLFGALGDEVMQANCLTLLAARSVEFGVDAEDVERWLADARQLADRSNNTHERLHTDLHLARLQQREGDHVGAAAAYAEVLPGLRRVGDQRCASRALIGLGWAAAVTGDDITAAEYLVEGMTTAVRVDSSREIAAGLFLLAGVRARTGQTEQAAQLLGAAEAVATRLDEPFRATLPREPGLAEHLTDQLGADRFATAHADGGTAPLSSLILRAGQSL